jgi:hypothetical protein
LLQTNNKNKKRRSSTPYNKKSLYAWTLLREQTRDND